MDYMFNNRFCKYDGSIMFKPEEWTCTDPDQHQFCRKISDTKYEYIQLKPECELIDDALKPPCGKDALNYLSGRTWVSDWYEDIIDVTDYTEEEIKEYTDPYGMPELDNQLIAECIFESTMID